VSARLIVVGAGPGGVSAALWARGRCEVLVIERAARAGGQLRAIHFVPPELPGSDVRDGAALADACERQLESAGVRVRYETAAAGLERRGRGVALVLERGGWLAADAILIATGLRRRRLQVPGETDFEGRGVSTSATRDREALAGRDVLIVGGGDAAFENALHLAEAGSRVTIAVRGRARARREFRERAAAAPRIEVLPGARVTAFLGDDRLRAVRLERGGAERERAFEAAVVKIGSIPNTEWCARAVRADAAGFLRADARGRTSVPRVWAAGDVIRPPVFAISVAAAGAALAIHDALGALGALAAPPRAAARARKRNRPEQKLRAAATGRVVRAGMRAGAQGRRTTRRTSTRG